MLHSCVKNQIINNNNNIIPNRSPCPNKGTPSVFFANHPFLRQTKIKIKLSVIVTFSVFSIFHLGFYQILIFCINNKKKMMFYFLFMISIKLLSRKVVKHKVGVFDSTIKKGLNLTIFYLRYFFWVVMFTLLDPPPQTFHIPNTHTSLHISPIRLYGHRQLLPITFQTLSLIFDK